eukprot:TRINITY_DN136513_c0_g1_i1.p1 TRINITY_DN136513_c0_g1~~TRINITY_DN136513_c0_g1_i1.p1  ORF type:complete len:96 (-),score=27.57 TRINITY_DN136513_c0_g1_i1:110-397(-)
MPTRIMKYSGVTKRAPRYRPGSRKGRIGKKRLLARQIAREVCGFAPYEKRMMELLRNNLDKRALRLAKKRIGSHQRAKRKREEMANFVRLAKLAE